MYEKFMKEAIRQAKIAEEMDEVPIGCIIVKDNEIVSYAHNLRESTQQSTAHAEMIAIERACYMLGSWRLDGCELYVTLEPCPMCSGAILQARIEKVIYGADDPKGGCICSCMSMYDIEGFNHYPKVISNICAEECGQLLTNFFQKKRKNSKS